MTEKESGNTLIVLSQGRFSFLRLGDLKFLSTNDRFQKIAAFDDVMSRMYVEMW